jgi:hypothetical protein
LEWAVYKQQFLCDAAGVSNFFSVNSSSNQTGFFLPNKAVIGCKLWLLSAWNNNESHLKHSRNHARRMVQHFSRGDCRVEIVAKEYRLRVTNCRRLFTHFVVWRDKTHALGGATVYCAKAFLSR